MWYGKAIKASAVGFDKQGPLQPLGFEKVVHPVAFGSGVSQKLFAVSPGIAPQRRLIELPDDVGLTWPQADPMPVDGDLAVAMAVGEVLPSGCRGLRFDE